MRLYKFYKKNCEPCIQLSKMLEETGLPEGVELVERNISEKENLHFLKAQGFKIVPVLMFETGENIQGMPTFEDLNKFLYKEV